MERLLKDVATKGGVTYLKIPDGAIPEQAFVDNTHLTEEGQRIKAAHIAKTILAE